MSISSLNQTFRRLSIVGINVLATNYHTTTHLQPPKILPILPLTVPNDKQVKSSNDSRIIFNTRSINVDLNLPPHRTSIKSIIESPWTIPHEIDNPLTINISKIDIVSDKSLNLPNFGNVMPKSAKKESIIIIRRKKIKKHKRRKYRKRMEAEFLKINKRRGVKREKMFQAELWAKVKEAQKFNAKEYVQSRIDILRRKIIPPIYKGYILPLAMVNKLMEEDRIKKEKKLNKPRLKL